MKYFACTVLVSCVLASVNHAVASQHASTPPALEGHGTSRMIEDAAPQPTSLGSGSTSSSSPSTTDHPFDIFFAFRIGFYPSKPIASLRLQVAWGKDQYLEPGALICSGMPIGDASGQQRSLEDSTVELYLDFGDQGLEQSQRLFTCSATVWHADAWWAPEVTVLEARGVDGQLADVSDDLCVDCGFSDHDDYGVPPRSDYDQCGSNLCGDVISDGRYTAGDALLTLKSAVGLVSPKYIQQYDVNRDGNVRGSDALRILRRAVELPGLLSCAQPPACG